MDDEFDPRYSPVRAPTPKEEAITEVVAFAQQIADEMDENLTLVQLVTAGSSPENVLSLRQDDSELSRIRVKADGRIIDFEFPWLSNANSVANEEVRFLITTIHWLAEKTW